MLVYFEIWFLYFEAVIDLCLLTCQRHLLGVRSIIFVLCCSLLLFIFVPKISYFNEAKKNKGSTKSAIRSSLKMKKHSTDSGFEANSEHDSQAFTPSRVNFSELLSLDQSTHDAEDRVRATLNKLEKNISTDVLRLLDKSSEMDTSEALVVVDSPEIREEMMRENEKLKATLARIRKQIKTMQQTTAAPSSGPAPPGYGNLQKTSIAESELEYESSEFNGSANKMTSSGLSSSGAEFAEDGYVGNETTSETDSGNYAEGSSEDQAQLQNRHKMILPTGEIR